MEEQISGQDTQPVESVTPEAPERQDSPLYARMKKAEEEAKALKEKLKSVEGRAGSSEFDLEEIVHLRTSGYSREEVERLKAYARGQGKTLSEVIDDPFVKAGIDGLRTTNAAQAATPAPSSRSSTAVSTSASKSFADMTPDERKANFAAHAAKFKRGSGRSNE